MNIHHRLDASLQPSSPPGAEPPSFRDRLQRMFQHRLLIGTGLVLAIAGAIAVVGYIQSKPVTLKIAVGPQGSEDVRVIHGLAQHLARENANVRLKVVREKGFAESADALDRHTVDLAVVRRDLAMPKNGQIIAVQRHEIAVLMAPSIVALPTPPEVASAAKSKNKSTSKARARGKAAAKAEPVTQPEPITKVEDLAGKTIGVVGLSPANVALLHTILAQSGIGPDKVQVLQFANEDLTTQLRAAKFDALLAVGPVGSKITAEAVAAITQGKSPPTFLEISSSEAIEQQKRVYESTEIPAGAFGGSRPAEAVETIGFANYIVAHRTLDDRVAGDFTRWLFSAKQALGGDLPAFTRIESPDTDKAATLAVHPGALAYLEGEQKTFFERYSESFYWGLMLMSFVGSGAAWLTSYARTSGSAKDRNDLEALIAMVGQVRTADSRLELDAIGAEIDAIMERTIRLMEARKLDLHRSSALTLAAEQARRAVGDRRLHLTA